MDKEEEEFKFQQFFIANFPIVKNFAQMLLKSEADAEDVAQDVFLKLWMNPDIWNKRDGVDTYIYTMTKNMILNRFKHLDVEREYEHFASSEQLLMELVEDGHTLDHIYYREALLLLRLTIERQPTQRRKVFELSRFQNLSNKEIAEKLGLSVRTVEHHIYLVLQELKKVIFFLFFSQII